MMRATFAGLLAVLLSGGALAQSWESVGPGGGSFLMACAIQPDDPDIVYVGGDIEGVFKSVDGGATWKAANRGMSDGNRTAAGFGIQELVISPTDYQTIYACTWLGIFKSVDGAAHWTYSSVDPLSDESESISFLAIDPTDSNVLYAGAGDADANDGGTGSLYRSVNGGSEWTLLDTGMPADAVVHGIVIDPTSPPNNRRILVSTNRGIFRSTDGGQSWGGANTGLPHTETRRLASHVNQGALTLWVGLDPGDGASFAGGIYRSTDGGDSWTSVTGDLPTTGYEGARGDGAPWFYYWKFTVDPSNPSILFAATNLGGWGDAWGIYRTTDGGATWTQTDTNVQQGWLDDVWWNDRNVSVLRIAPSDPSVIYSGSEYVQKSTDGGLSWTHTYATKKGDAWQGNGLELLEVYDFGFDPANADIVYLASDDMGMWRSEDGGVSFLRLDNPQNPEDVDCARSLIVDPANGHLFLGRTGGDDIDWGEGFVRGRFLTSTDKGDTWTWIDPGASGLPEGKLSIVMDETSPVEARVIYAGVYGSGVYKSTDGGQHWSSVSSGFGAMQEEIWQLAIDPNDPQVLYAAVNTTYGLGGGGIWKTSNGGGSWAKLGGLPDWDALCVAVNSAAGDTVYAGMSDSYEAPSDGGLYRSANGGGTWELVLHQPHVGAVLTHPMRQGVVYAASQPWWNYVDWLDSGVHWSEDGGDTWENIGGGLGHSWVLAMKVSPHDASDLWVGTHGGGVYRLRNALTPTDIAGNAVPNGFQLEQNTPNPFNAATTIRFNVPAASLVRVELYNIAGQHLRTLDDRWRESGWQTLTWDAGDFASGAYIYTLEAAGERYAKRCILVR